MCLEADSCTWTGAASADEFFPAAFEPDAFAHEANDNGRAIARSRFAAITDFFISLADTKQLPKKIPAAENFKIF